MKEDERRGRIDELPLERELITFQVIAVSVVVIFLSMTLACLNLDGQEREE